MYDSMTDELEKIAVSATFQARGIVGGVKSRIAKHLRAGVPLRGRGQFMAEQMKGKSKASLVREAASDLRHGTHGTTLRGIGRIQEALPRVPKKRKLVDVAALKRSAARRARA